LSIPLTINGAVFEYPVNFDENWGVDATGWAQAVTNGMLQMSGGSFPLTAEVDFGGSFGIKALYLKSRETNIASTGIVRLANASAGIVWRNGTNTGNLVLTTDAGNNLLFNGTPVAQVTLTNAHIFVGNISNIPTDVALSGDATLANTGALTLNTVNGNVGSFTNASITVNAKGLITAASSGTAPVTSVSGTANQITSTGGTTPVLAIANPLTLPGPVIAGGAIAMNANKITGLANGTTSTDAAAFGQIPVFAAAVQTASQIQTTTTSSTFTAATGQSVTITPVSASHRVKVTVSTQIATGSDRVRLTIKRNAVELSGASGFTDTTSAGATALATTISFSYIDSPATTSATTYQVFFRNNDNTTSITCGSTNFVSVIMAEEIA